MLTPAFRQISGQDRTGEGLELFKRCFHVLIAIPFLLLSLGIGHDPGEETGPVEVHIRVQILPAEGVDLPGKDLGDMGCTDPFPDAR